MANPLVIKIGGSLFEHVPKIFDILQKSGCQALIVPGGGKFADLARECAVNDDIAHWMAILGMEQFGWYIASMGIPTTAHLEIPSELLVFLPYIILRERDPLPHSWDITSDTVAAWISHFLGLDLIILKSVDGIHSEGRLLASVENVVITNDVDPSFLPFVFSHHVRVSVVNGTIDERIVSAIRGLPTRGTTIGF